MTQMNSIIPKLDPDVERRRALAKVYALLIRLADEADNKSGKVSSEEKTDEVPKVQDDPAN